VIGPTAEAADAEFADIAGEAMRTACPHAGHGARTSERETKETRVARSVFEASRVSFIPP
jgi:hypothetical protein